MLPGETTSLFYIDSCVEFYITNECNLTCSGCNRYNNYDFTGHYLWENSAPAVEIWKQRIAPRLITIIGGEPTSHPDLDQWIHGLCQAWPNVPVLVQTNGTRPIDKQRYLQYPNLGFGVAVHSAALDRGLKKHWNDIDRFDATEFTDIALIDSGPDTEFTVHDSDPELAFNCCAMRLSHTMLDGRLYRCPMVAVLPEFRKQYAVKLQPHQQQLLDSYQSLSADCSDEELKSFIDSRHQPMPQCRLCPESYVLHQVSFDANRKKRIKIIPR